MDDVNSMTKSILKNIMNLRKKVDQEKQQKVKRIIASSGIFKRCLSSGVNFTSILRAAFMRADPKSPKRKSTQAVFCAFGIFGRKSCA